MRRVYVEIESRIEFYGLERELKSPQRERVRNRHSYQPCLQTKEKKLRCLLPPILPLGDALPLHDYFAIISPRLFLVVFDSCPLTNIIFLVSPAEEKPALKICCACPETRRPRDDCMVMNGEEKCAKEIEDHKVNILTEITMHNFPCEHPRQIFPCVLRYSARLLFPQVCLRSVGFKV
jgi:cytochrome c oxidase assembly protein subunit 17